mmetsp:Transcript_40853/g.76445  ORF Transcript_40853/g.76445 Transcript_40853/m.76445 type:complete len:338 (+) Transcript_40853:803-1816(+)
MKLTLLRCVRLYRTDNAIKNHFNSTLRRKYPDRILDSASVGTGLSGDGEPPMKRPRSISAKERPPPQMGLGSSELPRRYAEDDASSSLCPRTPSWGSSEHPFNMLSSLAQASAAAAFSPAHQAVSRVASCPSPHSHRSLLRPTPLRPPPRLDSPVRPSLQAHQSQTSPLQRDSAESNALAMYMNAAAHSVLLAAMREQQHQQQNQHQPSSVSTTSTTTVPPPPASVHQPSQPTRSNSNELTDALSQLILQRQLQSLQDSRMHAVAPPPPNANLLTPFNIPTNTPAPQPSTLPLHLLQSLLGSLGASSSVSNTSGLSAQPDMPMDPESLVARAQSSER